MTELTFEEKLAATKHHTLERRKAPPRQKTRWEIEQRETFIRLQKRFYLGGKQGKKFDGMLVDLIMSEMAVRSFLTRGVVTCLKQEFERGTHEIV